MRGNESGALTVDRQPVRPRNLDAASQIAIAGRAIAVVPLGSSARF
jgi:hypothetical protein